MENKELEPMDEIKEIFGRIHNNLNAIKLLIQKFKNEHK